MWVVVEILERKNRIDLECIPLHPMYMLLLHIFQSQSLDSSWCIVACALH